MLMNIKNILNIEGTAQDFHFSVPEEKLDFIKGYVFHTPVEVSGRIANHAGAVVLNMQIAFSLLVTCDRCLKESVQEFSYQTEHLVVRFLNDEENEENFIVAKAESIDIAEIAVADLLLELPSKMLCKEDCKGLCPVCGCDRNLTECNCMAKIEFE
ncbi:MAG: DUF177 domain-containing protein [Oscillospiraceae bacterium]|nr:DUF177 domain-containing protein [Oscillospiraceae bacterium]